MYEHPENRALQPEYSVSLRVKFQVPSLANDHSRQYILCRMNFEATTVLTFHNFLPFLTILSQLVNAKRQLSVVYTFLSRTSGSFRQRSRVRCKCCVFVYASSLPCLSFRILVEFSVGSRTKFMTFCRQKKIVWYSPSRETAALTLGRCWGRSHVLVECSTLS